jgi:hypothetical protein
MKHTLPLALALTLVLAVAAAASTESFADQRAALAARVTTTVGDATNARIAPLVSEAQQRIIDAVRDVGAHQQTPMQILTFGQKMTLRRGRRAHTDPQLDLSDDQRNALDAYMRAVTDAALPIVRDDGRKIEALLMPAQRAALDTLRLQARDAMRALPAAAGLPDIAGALTDDGLANAGGFVVLVEIDPKALIAALR